MDSLILFFNSFLSYIVLFVIILIVAAVAMCIGINARKSKDVKLSAADAASGTGVQPEK